MGKKVVNSDNDQINDVEDELLDQEDNEELEDDLVEEDNKTKLQEVGENLEDEDDDLEDDLIVTIDGVTPPTPKHEEAEAPEWVRELRKSHRELVRRNKELEAKLRTNTTETKPVTLGPKPSIKDPDIDYDEDKFQAALDKWYEDKSKVDKANADAQAALDAEQKEWQSTLTAYTKAKAELKVKNFEDYEAVVQDVLSQTQQGIILKGCKNPAIVVYALGTNPKKAKELASITDPVKYAFAVANLEKDMKVTSRKAPSPEKTVRGSGSSSGAVDSTLERLRAEAERTGDYTKVMRYKRGKKKS